MVRPGRKVRSTRFFARLDLDLPCAAAVTLMSHLEPQSSESHSGHTVMAFDVRGRRDRASVDARVRKPVRPRWS